LGNRVINSIKEKQEKISAPSINASATPVGKPAASLPERDFCGQGVEIVNSYLIRK